MTSTMQKALLARFAWAYALVTAGLMSIVVAADLFLQFHRLFPSGTGLEHAIEYYADFLPYFFLQASPAGTLTAALFVLAPMRGRSELAALAAAGWSRRVFMVPLLVVAVAVTVLCFFVQEALLTSRAGAITRHKVMQKLAKGDRVPGLLAGERGVVLYLSMTPGGVMEKPVAFLFDDDNRIISGVVAEEARSSGGDFILTDASVFDYDGFGRPKKRGAPAGDSKISIGGFTGVASVRSFNFPTLAELIVQAKASPGSNRAMTAFWSRLVFPFMQAVLAVLGVGVFLSFGAGGTGRGVAWAFFVAAVAFFAHMLTVTLASNGYIPPLAGALFIPILSTAWGWWLYANSSGA